MKHLKIFEEMYIGEDSTWGEPVSKEEEVRKNRMDSLNRLRNPLNRKSKQSAKNYIYKISKPIINGTYTEEYWAPIRELFTKWSDMHVDWEEYETQRYFNMHEPFGSMKSPRKEWYIKITFYNNRGILNELIGTITAAFDGTREDPTKRYDLTLVLW